VLEFGGADHFGEVPLAVASGEQGQRRGSACEAGESVPLVERDVVECYRRGDRQKCSVTPLQCLIPRLTPPCIAVLAAARVFHRSRTDTALEVLPCAASGSPETEVAQAAVEPIDQCSGRHFGTSCAMERPRYRESRDNACSVMQPGKLEKILGVPSSLREVVDEVTSRHHFKPASANRPKPSRDETFIESTSIGPADGQRSRPRASPENAVRAAQAALRSCRESGRRRHSGLWRRTWRPPGRRRGRDRHADDAGRERECHQPR
jgi:hypothetical protein